MTAIMDGCIPDPQRAIDLAAAIVTERPDSMPVVAAATLAYVELLAEVSGHEHLTVTATKNYTDLLASLADDYALLEKFRDMYSD